MIALEVDSLFSDELAVTATYTPHGGTGFLIQVIIIDGIQGAPDAITGNGGVHILPVERNARSDFRHTTARQAGSVLVNAQDVAHPQYLDTVEADGVVWTVKALYDHV